MIKNLFFSIWFDDVGSGWLLFVTFFSLAFLAITIFVWARMKVQNQNFNKKLILPVILLFIMLYQLIPVYIDVVASFLSDVDKCIKFEKLAIKTSIIPWQKGGYYCKLGRYLMIAKQREGVLDAYSNAYKYINSYKYKCWGVSFLDYYMLGDYDTSIKIAENFIWHKSVVPPYSFISQSYIMQGNYEKALENINKAIEFKEDYFNYAQKAYILKILGKKEESDKLYKKAFKLCKNGDQRLKIKNKYYDLYKYENERLSEVRKNMK